MHVCQYIAINIDVIQPVSIIYIYIYIYIYDTFAPSYSTIASNRVQWQIKQNLARQLSTNTLMPPTFLLLFPLKHRVLLVRKPSIFSRRFPNTSGPVLVRPYLFNMSFKGSRLLFKEVTHYLFLVLCSNLQSYDIGYTYYT